MVIVMLGSQTMRYSLPTTWPSMIAFAISVVALAFIAGGIVGWILIEIER